MLNAVMAIVILSLDFKTHRISNWHLSLFALLLIFDLHQAPIMVAGVSILITIVIFMIARIGMGDIKLAVALIATEGSLLLSQDFFILALLMLLLTVLFRLLKYRHLRGSVAFSHVLLLPFLALYLAI
jgi:Flp pilus assembly protein protease CpaA